MIDRKLRYAIQELRAKGMTYREIRENVGQEISNGTMSYICKNVILPPNYAERYKSMLQANVKIARKKAVLVNTAKLKVRFEYIQQKAMLVVNSEEKIDYDKKCLAALYIGEGSKYKSYRGLAMGSSDPDLLRLYMALLIHCYDKEPTDFRARVQHRDDQDAKHLQEYWSDQLRLKPDSFYKPYADKRTVGKATLNQEYKGVCVVSCSGADIQLELDAIARLYGQKIWGIGAAG